jgi:hypothetical protein
MVYDVEKPDELWHQNRPSIIEATRNAANSMASR